MKFKTTVVTASKFCNFELLIMGEAKRRKTAMGEKYGQETRILPWVPITKSQSEKFVQWTTKGAWIGIVLTVIGWITIRFIGPAFGWWQVV